MNILFLPIDIDLSTLKFQRESEAEEFHEYNPYWSSSPIEKKTVEEYKLDNILNQLPFTKITTLTHKIQQREVKRHVDIYPSMTFEPGELEHIKENEPCGYRFVLKGNVDRLKVYNGKQWVTAILPSIPCCYLLNSTLGYHSVKEDINREIIYVRGFVDSEKHRCLIEKSYNKYGKYAIELL